MRLPDTEALKASARQRLPEQRSFRKDLIAGLTFAIVNIPQGMANALLVYVNPINGLYTLMIGTPIAALFTGSVLLNVSTTSALSVAAGSVLLPIPAESRVASMIVLVVLVGIIQLLAGLLKLGVLLRFVSNAVMVGFSTGVSLLIILGQLDDFTGYDSAFQGRIASALDTLLHPLQWHWADAAVGGLVLGLILFLSRTRYSKVSYVIALVAGMILGVLLNAVSPGLVVDISPLPGTFFTFTPPDFQYVWVLLPAALGIAIIGMVQGAGVAQNYPNPDGTFGDASRDFAGQGLSNIAAGIVTGIPGGGSMSGTALVVAAGGATRWANILGGLLIIPLVLVFGRVFDLVPLSALAGLLIAVGIQSLRPDAIQTVWNTSTPSRLAMGLTLAAALVIPLQYAVFVGVAVSIMLHVLRSPAQVRLVEFVPVEGGFPIEQPAPTRLSSETVTVLLPYGDLFFAAAANLETLLPDVNDAHRVAVILSLHGREEVGSTFIRVLQRYAQALHARDSRFYLVGVSPRLSGQLDRTGVTSLVGPERVIPETPQLGGAANAALTDAYAWLNVPVKYAVVPDVIP